MKERWIKLIETQRSQEHLDIRRKEKKDWWLQKQWDKSSMDYTKTGRRIKATQRLD
ncbi:hypothetical protein M433DRAFT_10511 [Acidomyces richmondensis BFW]|nr:hypothetical protein M433DRAFT_10511 [Acidomyces richmondensis BFW]